MMRDKIAQIISDDVDAHLNSGIPWDGIKAADAIIAALPDMVPDLVWEGNIASNGMGGRYVIDWYDAGDLCTQLTFHQFGNPPVQEYIAFAHIVDTLKAAANAHHKAQVMTALGLGGA